MIRWSPSRFAFASFAGAVLLSKQAGAQGSDPAAAEVLFREGRKLMQAGEFTEACPKFAESQRLEPAVGTLLNLAVCHQRQGRSATAWAEFLKAAAIARRAGQTRRQAMAERRAAELEKTLRYVRFVIAPESKRLKLLKLRIDGVVLGRPAWSSRVPVDPGQHELVASAPGRQPFKIEFRIKKDGETPNLHIPKLKVERKRKLTEPTHPTVIVERVSEPSGIRRSTIGYWVGGSGLAALGVGTFFGIQALGQNSTARDLCPSSPCESAEGVDKSNQAVTSALLADIFVGVGVVLVGTGLYLVLTDPGDSSEQTRQDRSSGGLRATLSPSVSPSFGGLTLSGSF